MNMLKRPIGLWFIVALVVLMALAGCSQGATGTETEQAAKSEAVTKIQSTEKSVETEGADETKVPQGGKRIVTDMMGREVRVDNTIERVAVLMPSDAEILYALDKGDLIVGRGTYVDYPEAVLSAPTVATGDDLNLEEIMALDPQVVIMTTMGKNDNQLASMEEAGLSVYLTDAKTIDEVYTAIEHLGELVGAEENAEALIQEMKETFDKYTALAAEQEEKTVYYEISPLEFGLWTGGSGSFMNEIGSMLNLKNIFSDVDGWGEISAEQVLERNPDYIITTSMYMGQGPTPEEEIMQREGWKDVQAVVDAHVYSANSDEFTRPGPRLINAIETLYTKIYGPAQ